MEIRREQLGEEFSCFFFNLRGVEESMMAGYLGSLNSFHSFRENKTALWAHPLVILMFLLRPGRNVYHMEISHFRGSQLGS